MHVHVSAACAHVFAVLPVVCFCMLVVNSFKFCPKRNVLAQVPSVHGSFRSACCLCSTPAARLCAAWESGFSRTRTESAERKTSHRFVIGLGGSLTKSNCGAPHLGAVLGNSQAPGPAAALSGRAGSTARAARFRARGFDRARGFLKRGASPRRLPCPRR